MIHCKHLKRLHWGLRIEPGDAVFHLVRFEWVPGWSGWHGEEKASELMWDSLRLLNIVRKLRPSLKKRSLKDRNLLADMRTLVKLIKEARKILSFVKSSRPLTDLTESTTAWKWTSEKTWALNLCSRLNGSCMLNYPNFSLPFIWLTNASGVALEAVLTKYKRIWETCALCIPPT